MEQFGAIWNSLRGKVEQHGVIWNTKVFLKNKSVNLKFAY